MNSLRLFSHVKIPFTLFIILSIIFVSVPLFSQKVIKSTPPELRLKWYEDHLAMKEQSKFKNLKWQFLGPTNISGRCTDIAVVSPKGKNYTIYAASASGGVWKTVNEGTTWEPVFENGPSTSVGDVTIAPSNQNIVWIGLGEANIFRSSMAGAGVYKSTNGGKTWKYMGLAGTHTIPRIVIHPKNPDIVYVAASGHEWTNNKERGVYKTTNGGKTWEKVLYINEKTGAIDLVMDPSDPNTLYAATWQRIRKHWNDPRNEPGYSGSSIYKTTDAGKNWKEIANGLPPAEYRGRIGIDISKSNPNVLYAFIDNYELAKKAKKGELDSYGRPKKGTIKGAEVYRTDDKGETWRKVSQSNQYMERLSATYGWVFGQIRVDPNDENTIYVMGLALNQSKDGGKTFHPLRGMHGDHHGLWIDPDNSNYLANTNDGGVSISYDGGKNWRSFTTNLPAVQFFNIAYDMDKPFHVYGSIQDHGSRRGIVDLSRGRDQIPAVEFTSAPGGEGCSHAVDPTNPNIVYSAGFYGRIQRSELVNGQWKTVSIVPKVKKGEPPLRGQWRAPFIISPHNPRIIYHGMQYLFRSMNRGDSWERISPDLTYNDKNEMGDIPYHTIFAISESPLKFGLIYVGTDDGKVHITKDGGIHWTEIMEGLPYRKWVSSICASAFDEGTVYMSQNGKRDDDFAAYLWKSTDYGKTWIDISNNIPCGPINVIKEDPKNKNVLYVGTDIGAYVSVNGGKTWHILGGNLPSTFVHDLIIHPRDDILVIATHGRGMFAMDVRYLQKLTEEILSKDVHLFKIEPAKLPRWRGRGKINGIINYYLKEPQKVSITITDKSDKTIKELKATGDAGLNVVIWDLTTNENKFVKPGIYNVKISAGTVKLEEKIEVKKFSL
ncbi:hypothetical protein DRQ09_00370 [candidate division KSB1 bacterium]|nr:MAG: hypothetical protein DRQ09_00370 [candidate division KSB1 bacterium]